MSAGGYDAFDDPYSYKGTNTLKNRIGLRDREALESFELEMTTLRGSEPLPEGNFDARHYRSVHHHLFQDIYSWAGQYRTIRTAKAGNWFCFPEHIEGEMERLFKQLHEAHTLEIDDQVAFTAAVARFLGELNAIHPFREGNGRSQLAFTHLLGMAAGMPFDFGKIKPASFMEAMIASFHCNLAPLENELTALLL